MIEHSLAHVLAMPNEEADRRAGILARLDEQIDWYEGGARRNNWGHKASKIISIVTAAAIAALAGAGSDPRLIAGLAALIVVAQGVQEVFQFQANWVNFGRTKEILKRERALYLARAGPYQRTDHPDRLLAERTEAVTAMELDAWVDSQAPDDKK